ncbi:hypothetical protein, partial [Salmonella enterica]|uniref:hypothetical protein n=1 Tax=Salmonella enterica TaxID=28901 RepID=UPI001CB85499
HLSTLPGRYSDIVNKNRQVKMHHTRRLPDFLVGCCNDEIKAEKGTQNAIIRRKKCDKDYVA